MSDLVLKLNPSFGIAPYLMNCKSFNGSVTSFELSNPATKFLGFANSNEYLSKKTCLGMITSP